ncbi:hypothetical protein T440DRAFT_478303 [Plenodomus tracheiphilus IPT5]|uniref:Uncharacterized protein n=1 Tax=Plenodomus tracheiphilus IPT5 TaxID=1408161 RepID=A0A6A7BBS3_9PLEO|nr:hypothetical protein T440DRAFT_478303 [Plenodomus tracheiphilus IPT5]
MKARRRHLTAPAVISAMLPLSNLLSKVPFAVALAAAARLPDGHGIDQLSSKPMDVVEIGLIVLDQYLYSLSCMGQWFAARSIPTGHFALLASCLNCRGFLGLDLIAGICEIVVSTITYELASFPSGDRELYAIVQERCVAVTAR